MPKITNRKKVTFKPSTTGTLLGIDGKFSSIIADADTGVIVSQTFKAVRRELIAGKTHTTVLKVRYDDTCGNGYATFGCTYELYDSQYMISTTWVSGGCSQDTIAKLFPEIVPLLGWHGFGDTHSAIAENVAYMCSDRDCWGRLAGEPSRWDTCLEVEGVPFPILVQKQISAFKRAGIVFPEEFGYATVPTTEIKELLYMKRSVDAYDFSPKYTLASDPTTQWADGMFDTELRLQQFLDMLKTCKVRLTRTPADYSKGKARDLDAAKDILFPLGVYMTDDELCDPGLEARLKNLDLVLQEDFKTMMRSVGFQTQLDAETLAKLTKA